MIKLSDRVSILTHGEDWLCPAHDEAAWVGVHPSVEDDAAEDEEEVERDGDVAKEGDCQGKGKQPEDDANEAERKHFDLSHQTLF